MIKNWYYQLSTQIFWVFLETAFQITRSLDNLYIKAHSYFSRPVTASEMRSCRISKFFYARFIKKISIWRDTMRFLLSNLFQK